MGTSAGDNIDVGIGIRSLPGSEQTVDRLNAKLAQFRTEVAKGFPTAGAQALAGQVNIAIGAFERMGKTIDVTNAKTVAAFRAEGDALSVYLVKLGATDAELNKIGATIARVEQRSGAARVGGLFQPVPASTIGSYDRLGGRLRTAANAATLLGVNVASGTGSLTGMAVAAGNVAAGLAAFALGPVGLTIAAVGALVTVVVGVANAIRGWREEQEKLKKSRIAGLADDPFLERAVESTTAAIEIQRHATAEAIQLAVARTRGEVAARRSAIEQEFADERERIVRTGALQADQDAAVIAARRRRNEQLAALNRELAEREAQAQAKLTEGEVSLIRKATLDATTIRRVEANDVFQRERTRLDKELQEGKITQDQFNTQLATAARIRALALEAIQKDSGDTLKKIVADTENAILELTGHNSEARRRIITEEFDERIKKAKEAGATEAQIASINRERGLRLAAVDLADLEASGTRALDGLNTKLQETQALAISGAITEREARERVLSAYEATRAELEKIIPQLSLIATLTGNADATRAVDELRLKYLDLGNTIAGLKDRFREVKAALRDSTEQALSGLFTDAFRLLGRNTPELDALKAQLAGAEHELETLLAGPPTAQAGERIRQVRDEITELRVRIDDSKRSIETWKDALVNAAGVIVSALEEVLAKMAAVAIIQNVMGLFGGHGASTADISADVTRLATSRGFASGGQIRGPKGHDAIPAWLTDEEYVISANRVRQFGKGFFDLINFAGQLPPIVTPNQLRRGYAEGGLVRGGVGASSSVSLDDRLRLEVEAHPDAIVRVLESPKGAQVVLRILANHQRAARSALGG